MERWEYIPLGIIVLVFAVITVGVIDASYHHWLEEHAAEHVRPKGWEPPAIVRHENCATWDEIRFECEDD
jgi:hypothetical protein